MINLGELERKLNSDPNLREEFFKDPVYVLQREGIFLSFEHQRELREKVATLTSQNTPISALAIGIHAGLSKVQ